jgi:hypothetical protein
VGFNRLVLEQLLPQFCSYYAYDVTGFRSDALQRIGDHDAMWFLEALRTQTVSFESPFFRSAQSGAKEQIFWQGEKSVSPRPITIWVEPIVTIAAAGRLHSQFGWPKKAIGLQSKKNWAFDLVGYDSALTPALVCEVKKSHREVDKLVEAMVEYLAKPPLSDEPRNQQMRNAYRKVVAVRQMKPLLLWALGPENYGKVFRPVWDADNTTRLEEVEENALKWPNEPQGA